MPFNIKQFFTKISSDEKQVKSHISISGLPIKAKNILIIFPIKKDFFRVASYAYRNLPYDKDNIEFHYMVNSNYLDFFPIRKGFVYKMIFNNKLKIENKNELAEDLNNKKFDIIIDLNIEYESSINSFIINQDSNYKIGFKHNKSDLLYNVQLDISNSQIAERGYKQILELI